MQQKSEFEFCKACNINHDQGLRHKYFPNHKKSLSSFLSRFRKKLSDVRFFLNAPIPLDPQLASRNRFWCVFCDQDVHEHSSSFACANAIRHLASAQHVKNLRHFFWKYGAAANQLDAFMFSDDDVTKWERKCEARKDEASEGSRRTVLGPSNDDQMSIRYLVQDFLESRMLLPRRKRALIQNRLLCQIFWFKGEAILSLMMVDNGQVMVTPVINRLSKVIRW
ncbi:TITAN-like protein isoform X2 [Vigna umbellata]|uniref:TITAN-like protein isoform X2 n=1 Tax=Vigna umbellata TaxID=87088 RepID=UPI001F5F174B|nr:TITAN-like protein isoform X2 [Vigna umbellata]